MPAVLRELDALHARLVAMKDHDEASRGVLSRGTSPLDDQLERLARHDDDASVGRAFGTRPPCIIYSLAMML